MEIRMAHAAGFNFYYDFSGTRLRRNHIFDPERLFVLVNDGCFQISIPPFWWTRLYSFSAWRTVPARGFGSGPGRVE
jgi:hypothetical protein